MFITCHHNIRTGLFRHLPPNACRCLCKGTTDFKSSPCRHGPGTVGAQSGMCDSNTVLQYISNWNDKIQIPSTTTQRVVGAR